MKTPALSAVLFACFLASVSIGVQAAEPVILTPPAPDTPRINGPGVFGVRPGSPLLYSIPATGKRPMTFGVNDLPAGPKVDSATRPITGGLSKESEIEVTSGDKRIPVSPTGNSKPKSLRTASS